MRGSLLAAVGLSLACLGCAMFNKSELFAAYGAEGSVVYYRINLRGYGSLGKVNYGSGWHPGSEVDELFGDVTGQGDARVSALRQRQRAIDASTRAYADAIEAQKDDERDAAAARMRRVMPDFDPLLSDPKPDGTRAEEIPVVAPAEKSRAEAFNYVGKKYVMVLANDPDEILKLIRESSQKKQLVDTVASFARGRADQASVASTFALEQAALAAKQLAERLEVVRGNLGASPDAASLKTHIEYLKTLVTP